MGRITERLVNGLYLFPVAHGDLRSERNEGAFAAGFTVQVFVCVKILKVGVENLDKRGFKGGVDGPHDF